jgi:signal transduction histidine kinase
MSRAPIRLRVTLAFTAAMALVLIAVGLFLYLRLEAQLDDSIDNGLRSRAGEVSALARASQSGLQGSRGTSLIEVEESFAQVLTPGGRVLDSTPQLRQQPVLSAPELGEAAKSPAFFERAGLPGIEATARLLAAPVETADGELIVVVGSSLGDRDEALDSLATLFLLGGPAALLLASLAGYAAAGSALRPVEAMRRRAAEISAREPGERLPVPSADDELRRLGETLNEMLARIESTLERERRFVDDASHELRTPLALQKTELELALRQGASEDELRVAIASALEEVNRLVKLAEDLLVVARSEEGGLAIAPQPLSVAELLLAVGERFRVRAAESGRALTVDRGSGLTVAGDRLRLEQALIGMVDNALRHGAGEIRIWAVANGDRVRLHVGDRGAGFAAEFLPHAFERFSRADAARGSDSSGLGLAIVEAIARAHDGRAGAGNDPAGGADVWIEVPSPPGQVTDTRFHRRFIRPRYNGLHRSTEGGTVTKRTKLLIVGASALALAAGGAGIASATGSDDSERSISGSALERASAAALETTGDGTVSETEVGDEESYYEVEVTKADGSQTDVQLDRDFNPVGHSADEEESP